MGTRTAWGWGTGGLAECLEWRAPGCVRVCVSACVHMCVHTCVTGYDYLHVCSGVCMDVGMPTGLWARVLMYTSVSCMSVYVHKHMLHYNCVITCTCIHMCTYTYLRTCMLPWHWSLVTKMGWRRCSCSYPGVPGWPR